jgi:LysM repeat protein
MTDTEITIKNTKAEIMEALNNALKRAELAEKGRLNPEKVEKEKIEKKAVETAKKAVEQNIFSKELNDKFNDLQTAIAAEESRLQELFGVGRELQKLALTIEAGKDSLAKIEAEKKDSFAKIEAEKKDSLAKIEAEKSEKLEAAKTKLNCLNAEFTQKSEEYKAEHDAYQKKLKIDRTREAEEYQYNLTRTREKEENMWADKKAERESQLLKREALAKELLAEAESKIEYIRTLEQKVENIPHLLQSEKDSAIAATTATLQKEHEYKSTLSSKDYQGSIARLEDKITYLQKELDSTSKSVNTLQGKLDKAYAEMRELATITVESASGVKIISNTENKSI